MVTSIPLKNTISSWHEESSNCLSPNEINICKLFPGVPALAKNCVQYASTQGWLHHNATMAHTEL